MKCKEGLNRLQHFSLEKVQLVWNIAIKVYTTHESFVELRWSSTIISHNDFS